MKRTVVLFWSYCCLCLHGMTQDVISFPLTEDLNALDGSRSLVALPNEIGETGSFITLDSSSSCAAVSNTGVYAFAR